MGGSSRQSQSAPARAQMRPPPGQNGMPPGAAGPVDPVERQRQMLAQRIAAAQQMTTGTGQPGGLYNNRSIDAATGRNLSYKGGRQSR